LFTKAFFSLCDVGDDGSIVLLVVCLVIHLVVDVVVVDGWRLGTRELA